MELKEEFTIGAFDFGIDSANKKRYSLVIQLKSKTNAQ